MIYFFLVILWEEIFKLFFSIVLDSPTSYYYYYYYERYEYNPIVLSHKNIQSEYNVTQNKAIIHWLKK